MSVKLATATATDSASVTDFVQNGHMDAVWPLDYKNQARFDLGSFLRGQIQGQTTGNALAPKVTVRLRRSPSFDLEFDPSSSFDLEFELEGQVAHS